MVLRRSLWLYRVCCGVPVLKGSGSGLGYGFGYEGRDLAGVQFAYHAWDILCVGMVYHAQIDSVQVFRPLNQSDSLVRRYLIRALVP